MIQPWQRPPETGRPVRAARHPFLALAVATVALLAACGGGSTGPADTTPPTVSISDSVTAATATGEVTFIFTFSEDVGTSFTLSDVTVTGGTKAATLGKTDATHYTLVVTPTAATAGTITVTVPAGSFSDLAGNANAAAASATQAYDTVAVLVVDGKWLFREILSDVTNGVTCDNSGVLTLTQAAKAFTGVLVQTQTCALPTGVTVVSGTFAITDGSVAGAAIAFTQPGDIPCTYQGSMVGDPPSSQTGTLTCDGSVLGTTYHFTGTWQAQGRFADVTFDSSVLSYALIGFAGAEDSSLAPDPAGGANTVGRVVRSATALTYAGTIISTMAGTTFTVGKIPFDANRTRMSVRVYAPGAGIRVRLKVEDHTDGTRSVETEATTTTAGAWETLLFDFSTPASGTPALDLTRTYDRASIFFDFGVAGSTAGVKTYYFDDLRFLP
jgi:hypothetical protein